MALVSLALLSAPSAVYAAEAKPDCCRQGDTEIARSLKNADRLYAQFKPREALAELQKILQVDPNHIEALIKTARARIDVGDQIAEQGADWKERKVQGIQDRRRFRAQSRAGRRQFYLGPFLRGRGGGKYRDGVADRQTIGARRRNSR